MWERIGDSYDMVQETVLPTSYNTLVEFAYALSINDRPAAERRVLSPSLVDIATSLGLGQNPLTEMWGGYCADQYTQGTPCNILLTKVNQENQQATESAVRLEMSQVGNDWLISKIEPCTYIAFGNGGSRCD